MRRVALAGRVLAARAWLLACDRALSVTMRAYPAYERACNRVEDLLTERAEAQSEDGDR